jgi:hypothetical protein
MIPETQEVFFNCFKINVLHFDLRFPPGSWRRWFAPPTGSDRHPGKRALSVNSPFFAFSCTFGCVHDKVGFQDQVRMIFVVFSTIFVFH